MSNRSLTLPLESTIKISHPSSFDPHDAAGVNQPELQPEASHSHSQLHSSKKINQALHVPLSDIPEEDKDRMERSGIRTTTAAENGCIKLDSEYDNDGNDDDDSEDLIESQQEPEHKHEYDEHKHGRSKLWIQDGSELPILSSSLSSQTDLHLLANTSISDVFPENPFVDHHSLQLDQHHPHDLSMYPSSSANASVHESGYGSIDNMDNDRSMSISFGQSSSQEQSTHSNTSFDTSDTTSFKTIKIRNSNDNTLSSASFKHHHHHNNYDDDYFNANDVNGTSARSSAVPTTVNQPRIHNTNPRNKHKHKHGKSELNDLAQTIKSHHKQQQQQQHQHLSQEMSIDSTTSLSSNINDNDISSEAMPILPTTHRHHNNHHHHHHNHNRQRRDSLYRIHIRQRSVSQLIGRFKGVEQPLSYRDIKFSILFFAQLGIMIFLTLNYGPEAIGPTVQNTPDASTMAALACCSGLISIVISTLALIFMTLITEKLVEIALYVAISLAFAWGTIGAVVLSPRFKFVPITGLALLGLITAYAFVVWDRIPFTSANLKTALTAIRSRPAVVAVAFALQVCMLVWAILMMFTVVGIYNAFQSHVMVDLKWRIACYVGLGVSSYWNVQLLLYMVHVTVAGIVKNWWFNEKSSELPPPTSPSSHLCTNERQLKPYQSPDEAVVARSFQRAAFYSFGSVCFGSLLVSFVRLLRRIPKYIHPCSNNRDTVLQDRFVSCMDVLGSKFNRFAFIYVGMYGYSFVEAGEKASALLKKRGWKKIVTDNLISDVLLLVSLVIGGVSGCLTVWIEYVGSSALTSINHPTCTSFLIGSTIGLVLSSILFGIISSSVNAVIMLFAGNPVEFEENHPELSHEMRAAWREVFPGKVDSVVTNHSAQDLA